MLPALRWRAPSRPFSRFAVLPQFLLCLRYRFAVGAFSQCARDSRCWQHLCCCFILWTFASSCHRRSLCNFLLSISAIRGLIPCSSLSLVIVSVASASSSLNYPALPRRHNWSLLQHYAWPCCACLLVRRFVHRVRGSRGKQLSVRIVMFCAVPATAWTRIASGRRW